MQAADVSRSTRGLEEATLSILYRYRGAAVEPDRSSRIIDSFSVEEILDLLGIEAEGRKPFRDPGSLFWFASGFQSWSPGWELRGHDRNPRLRLVRVLERYTERDRQRLRRSELAAHGFAYLRSGERYLALFSRNRGGPPVTLRIDRRRMRIAVELHSDGARFAEGEPLAELVLLRRDGYFALRDAAAALFSDLTVMRRADFLKGAEAGPLTSGGWCSWYSHYTAIDEPTIRSDLEGLAASPNLIRELFASRGRPTIFQLDDGWQRAVGDWDPHPQRFPEGMRRIAELIASKGFLPGLWLAPFAVAPSARLFREHRDWLLRSEDGRLVRAGYNPDWERLFYCLDLSREEVRAYLRELFDRIIDEWGFRYLKLDFLYAGMLNGRHSGGGGAYRWYREALEPIVSRERNRSGEPIAFLGCGAPLESSVSLFGLMRIGADTKAAWDQPDLKAIAHMGRPAAHINLRDTIGRAFMNRTLYYADPDVVFLRSARGRLTRSEKELIIAAALLFGSQLMTSDDYRLSLEDEEGALTRWALALAERLSGRDYGAVMIAADLWRCFSRDGEVGGIINLRSRSARIPAPDAERWGLSGELIAPSGAGGAPTSLGKGAEVRAQPAEGRRAAPAAAQAGFEAGRAAPVPTRAARRARDVIVAPHCASLWLHPRANDPL